MSLLPRHGHGFVGTDCFLQVSMASRGLQSALEMDECWVRLDRLQAMTCHTLQLQSNQASETLRRSLSGDVASERDETSASNAHAELLAMPGHARGRVVLFAQLCRVSDAVEISRGEAEEA